MTKPTQAQIKAAKKEYLNRCGHYQPPSEETFAAILTAAAEVGDEQPKRHTISGSDAADDDDILPAAEVGEKTTYGHLLGDGPAIRAKNETIERCAGWLVEEAKALRSQVSGGDGSENQWIEAKALDRSAIALRKLKDEGQ